jgi:hypothetical protein
MKKQRIVGVKCNVLGKGMFPSEVRVDIPGNRSDAENLLGIQGYCVGMTTLKRTLDGSYYLPVELFGRKSKDYLCWINVDGDVRSVRVGENQLVYS